MLRVPCFAHFVATTTYDARVRGLVWRQQFRYRGDVLFDVPRKSRTWRETRNFLILIAFVFHRWPGRLFHPPRRWSSEKKEPPTKKSHEKLRLFQGQAATCRLFLEGVNISENQRTRIYIHVFINRYVAWVFQDSNWIGANTRGHVKT